MDRELLPMIDEHSSRPSFLELYSLQHLSDAPRLAVGHLLQAVMSDGMQKHFCQEAFDWFQLLAQAGYFMHTGSTIGENMYGLIQKSKTKNNQSSDLTRLQKKICLIAMILPFALNKMRELSLTVDDNEETGGGYINQSSFRRCANNFLNVLRVHKTVIAFCFVVRNALVTAQKVSYLFSWSQSFYPVHKYLGITIERNNMSSSKTKEVTSKAASIIFIAAVCIKITELLHRLNDASSSVVNINESNAIEDTHITGPAPLSDNIKYDFLSSQCPLCKLERKKPCSSSGGYVFCYDCLREALSRHPFCPVTGIPCSLNNIILLAESS